MTLDERDFEHKPIKFVGTHLRDIIFVGVDDREAFDRIAVPVHDHGWNEEGHVLTKTVEQDLGTAKVRVIFQYWIKSLTTDAWWSRRAKRISEAQP